MPQKRNIASTEKTTPEFLKNSVNELDRSHRKLVVIQLSGGNDGLNTVIPSLQDGYYRNRPNIHIPKKNTLFLNEAYGFNKALSGLRDLFFESEVSIINNVGYPNPTRSHFKSLDIWKTGSDSNHLKKTGWLGRYLDATCQPGDEYKLTAIEVNDVLSLVLKGESYKGVSIDNLTELFDELNSTRIKQFIRHYKKRKPLENENLEYIYKTLTLGHQAIQNIYTPYSKINFTKPFPDTKLGNDLSSIAKLIVSEAETQIFYVSHGTFDTHINQNGRQNALLKNLGDSLNAFVNSLKTHNKFKEVCILIFSEFGRRVKENGSKGTDHGAGNNLFIVSSHLNKAGVFNPLMSLEKLVNGDLGFEIDFRQIYATILEDWFDADATQILGKAFPKLNLFKNLDYVV